MQRYSFVGYKPGSTFIVPRFYPNTAVKNGLPMPATFVTSAYDGGVELSEDQFLKLKARGYELQPLHGDLPTAMNEVDPVARARRDARLLGEANARANVTANRSGAEDLARANAVIPKAKPASAK